MVCVRCHLFCLSKPRIIFIGGRLIYLPPYSPDYNPIEEAFSAIKSFLQRHESRFTGPKQIPWLVNEAFASITPDDAIGWFSDCGYL